MHRSVSLLVVLLAGCASAPSTYSVRSAASVESAPAPRATIGRALSEEPPAPGASTDGWVGLAGAAPAPMAGMHHHHHPGMVMPPSTEVPDAH